MKKGRPGARLEVLAPLAAADDLEALLLAESTTIGVRRSAVERRALPRERAEVRVLDYPVAVKIVTLPSGARRAKPEYEDVRRVAQATGQPLRTILFLAQEAAERAFPGRV
jgi:uncharacterized protein (DUF111 family)